MIRRILSVFVFTTLLVGLIYVLAAQPSNAAAKADRGRELYMTYCASCHGEEGKGNGPAAPALKTAPSDLTHIAKVEGKFPALRVKRIIGGDDFITGHGSREMPVWGTVFREKRDRMMATSNIYALTKYVESIQGK